MESQTKEQLLKELRKLHLVKRDAQAKERNLLLKDDLDQYLTYSDTWLFGLSESEKKLVIKSRCFHYIDWFAENVVTEWTQDKKTHISYPSPDFHLELWEYCYGDFDIVCAISRGFAKTTAVSKIYVLWALLFAIEPAILLIMPKDLGTATVGEIRYQLETNIEIRDIWGDLVPVSNKKDKTNQIWRQRTLQLLNNCTLETISQRQKIRGKRPTKVIVDDPQELEDVENPARARKFIVWFWTSVYNALNVEESSVVVLGTIISDNCFVNVLLTEADTRDFKVVKYSAIEDFETKGFNGKLLWPERWTKQKLMKRYKKIGHDEFMQEFQHIPMPIKANFVFRNRARMVKVPVLADTESGIKFYIDPEEKKRKWKYIFIGIDFAMGGVGNDYTVAEARNEKGELLAMWRGWIAQDLFCGILDEMINLLTNDIATVSITPETNSADLFMKVARDYAWFWRFTRERVFDKITKKETDKFGFRTGKNKPILIAAFQSRLDEKEKVVQVSAEQWLEINKYVRSEDGRTMQAMNPYNDDTVIAGCLAFYTIDQGMPADAVEMFA